MADILHPGWLQLRDADMHVPASLVGSQRSRLLQEREWPLGKKVFGEGAGVRRAFGDASGGACVVLSVRPKPTGKGDDDHQAIV